MIINFELSLEIADMNKLVTEFFSGINDISQQIQTVTGGLDMSKAQAAYEKALANNASQYEALESFLTETNNSFESMNDITTSVNDEEIDTLISNEAADQTENFDKEIDEKINKLKERMAN